MAVCARHGAQPNAFSIDDLVKRPALAVTRTDKPTSPVDQELVSRGLKRRVVMRSVYFMAALSIVADSDLMMVIPVVSQKTCDRLRLGCLRGPSRSFIVWRLSRWSRKIF